MMLCAARRSQINLVKFIPKVLRDARSIVAQSPAMTLALFYKN